MKRPIETDYTSHVAYTRALEQYCDTLAQPEQEPEWKDVLIEQQEETILWQAERISELLDEQPKREWVGLTDEEIEAMFLQCGGKWNGDQWVIEDADFHPFVRTIEAAHGIREKNT